MKKLGQVIQEIDFYGKPFMFQENETQKYHTKTGNIFTFLVIIACIVIGFLFGKEIYERKSPLVVLSEETIPISRFNLSDYPVIFSFFKSDGTLMDDPLSVVSVATLKIGLDENLKSTHEMFLGLQECDASKFGKQFRTQVTNQLNDGLSTDFKKIGFYCIHHDGLFVQNDYVSYNSTSLKIVFTKCNPNYQACHPQYNELAKNFFIAVSTFDSYLDSKDYSNPIRYYLKTIGKEVNDAFTKSSYINIQKGNLINNKGWLLEDVEEIEFFAQKPVKEDINLIVDNHIYQIILDSPNRRNVITRSYLRVQDLLAKIGGILNFLVFTSSLMIKNYVDYSYYSHFAKLFYGKNDLLNSNLDNSCNPNPDINLNILSKSSQVMNRLPNSTINLFSLNANNKEVLSLHKPENENKCNKINEEKISKFDLVDKVDNDISKDKIKAINNCDHAEKIEISGFHEMSYISYIVKHRLTCKNSKSTDKYFNIVKELLSFNKLLYIRKAIIKEI